MFCVHVVDLSEDVRINGEITKCHINQSIRIRATSPLEAVSKPLKYSEQTSELHEAVEQVGVVFVTNHDPEEGLQPTDKTLDHLLSRLPGFHVIHVGSAVVSFVFFPGPTSAVRGSVFVPADDFIRFERNGLIRFVDFHNPVLDFIGVMTDR